MSKEEFNPDIIEREFQFLIDEFGYVMTRNEERSYDGYAYAYLIEYQANERRVNLTFDYKENFYYFTIIRGLDTRIPNDTDTENLRPFWQLFHKFDPQLQPDMIQPENQSYVQAAEMNAQLLKKYCTKILSGEEWI